MSLIRSERSAAGLLLGAALLGLVLANTPLGPELHGIQATTLAVPGAGVGLSVGAWVSEGLLAIFFLVVAIELKHELTAGQLNSVRKAARPAIAALGGVAAPAVLYLVVTAGSGYTAGWPVPTATDIAFVLGVLAVLGHGLPRRIRVFLLALAVLDDLVAILIIAVFFAHDVEPLLLLAAAAALAAFAGLARARRGRMRAPVTIVMALVGVLTWELVLASGVHATIAGVALGLVLPAEPGRRLAHALEPYSNGLVLPVFAFSAALVTIPSVGPAQLAAPFWGIAVALPIGKFVGILAGGAIGRLLTPAALRERPDARGMVIVAVLGGIGFTVSLLMNELAFAAHPEVADEGTLAVLTGSGVSIVAAAIIVPLLGRHYRRAVPVSRPAG